MHDVFLDDRKYRAITGKYKIYLHVVNSLMNVYLVNITPETKRHRTTLVMVPHDTCASLIIYNYNIILMMPCTKLMVDVVRMLLVIHNTGAPVRSLYLQVFHH